MGHCHGFNLPEFDAGLAEMRACARPRASRLATGTAEMFALESLGVVLTQRSARDTPRPSRCCSEALDAGGNELGARRYAAVDPAARLAEMPARERGSEVRGPRDGSSEALDIARETGMAFGGPLILATQGSACMTIRGERERCRAEAADVIARRAASIGHNQIGYRQHGIEDALARGDWPRALQHAAALEDYTRDEPLPYCDLLIARARAVVACARRPQDAVAQAELERLKSRAQALRLKWPVTWPSV